MTRLSHEKSTFSLRRSWALLLLIPMLFASVWIAIQHVIPAHADASYTTSWVGQSASMSGANGQWVQDFINTAVVQSDGTIWTASGWDEAGNKYGEYKNGQVVGSNLDQNNHGLNSNSARSVTDNNGHTWTIQNITYVGGDKVCRDDNSGICITGDNGFRPNALAIANDGSLMVGDNGPDQQIKFYDVSSDSPIQVRTFGDQGGVWAGPTPGLTGPLRFSGIWGTGQDSSGNIYVIGNFPGGGSWMRSLTPDGTMNWQRYGKVFVGNAAPDMSTNGEDVYDHNALYKMDYARTDPGTEVTGDFPYAVTVDPWNHPDDPRLATSDNNGNPVDTQATADAHYIFGVVPKWIRNCFSHKFMVTTSMFSGQLTLYSLEGQFWVHTSFNNGPDSWPWADFMDENCNLWLSSDDGHVTQYPATGVDGSGNLNYGSVVSYPQLTDFNEVARLQYDASNDTMYVSGFTPSRPRGGGWGDAGAVFKRYTNWSSSPNNDLTIDLPYDFRHYGDGSDDYSDSTIMQEWDVVGDYVLTVFGTDNDQTHQHGSPAIFSLSDGSRVADLTPQSPIVTNDLGWVDVRGITGGKRSNGEYLLFMEDDWKNKSVLFRWCPSGNCS